MPTTRKVRKLSKARDAMNNDDISSLIAPLPPGQEPKPPVPLPPPPPPHPPIHNLYRDRITQYKAFEDFLQERLGGAGVRYWKVWARDTFMHNAFRSTNIFSFLSSTRRQATASSVMVQKTCRIDHDSIAEYKPFNEETWMYYREALRFTSYGHFLTREGEAQLLSAGTPLVNPQGAVTGSRQVLPYLTQLANLGFILPPDHFVHLSPNDPALIRYVDERGLERDLTVETTIAKYLRKVYPDASESKLREAADLHKLYCLDDGVEFVDDFEGILKGYQNGPASCMTKGESFYRSHVHPISAYVKRPGIKLALLRNANGAGYQARCFVYETPAGEKRYIRNYGSALLIAKLTMKGYKGPGQWTGATLNKIPALDRDGNPLPGTWVLPYLDDVSNKHNGGCQAAYTDDSMDHWICGTETELTPLRRNNLPGAQHQALTTQYGLVGTYPEYTKERHTYWRAMISGKPYSKPRQGKFNEFGETLCSSCGMIFEKPYTVPVYAEALEVADGSTINYCHNCATRHYLFKLDAEQDGRPLHARHAHVFAVPQTNPAGQVYYGDALADIAQRQSRYDIHLIDDREKFGFIRLSGFDNYKIVRKTDDYVKTGTDWTHKRDLCTTVFGLPAHKNACFFLGQNSETDLQYFPKDQKQLRTAFIAGQFFIVDDKIVYDKANPFQPEHRKKFFSSVELRDTEDAEGDTALPEEELVLDRVPLIDAYSVLTANHVTSLAPHGGNRAVMVNATSNAVARASMNLTQLMPRVTADFFTSTGRIFLSLTEDLHAGLEGINRLSPHMTHVLYQGRLTNLTEAFTNGPTPGDSGTSTGEAPTLASYLALHSTAGAIPTFITV